MVPVGKGRIRSMAFFWKACGRWAGVYIYIPGNESVMLLLLNCLCVCRGRKGRVSWWRHMHRSLVLTDLLYLWINLKFVRLMPHLEDRVLDNRLFFNTQSTMMDRHYCEIAGLSMFSVKITVEIKKFTAVLMLVVFVYCLRKMKSGSVFFKW